MARNQTSIDPRLVPDNWSLDVCFDGTCFESLECTSWGDIAETEIGTRINVVCIGSDGKARLEGSYRDQTTPDRATFDLTVRPNNYTPIAGAIRLARSAGSTFEARLSYGCVVGGERKVLGYFPLPDVDFPTVSLPAIDKLGGGNADSFPITVNVTWAGQTDFVDLSEMDCQPFENVTGETTVSVSQCLGAVGATGTDSCGETQTQRGVCDSWETVTTGTDTFTVLDSVDGGATYPDSEVVAGLGDAIYADCDAVYTTDGRIVTCAGAYTLETIPVVAGGFTVAAKDLLGFGSNGAYTYDNDRNEWVLAQSNTPLAVTLNVAGSDGTVMFMGGPSDGITIGAIYQYSLDGMSFVQPATPLTIPSWSTISDVILDANVKDGLISVLVSNGTQTKLVWSIDGENWNDSYTWNFVPTDAAQILRPLSSLTYVILDNNLYVNPSGLCECDWRLEKTVPATHSDAVWGACSADPTKLHYVWTSA